MFLTLCKQLLGGGKRILHRRGVIHHHVTIARRLVYHKPAAHRVVDPGLQRLALLVISREAHAIGMEGQRLSAVHDQVVAVIEGNLVRAQQRQAAVFARGGNPRFNAVDIDCVGGLALQTQNDGLWGAVASTRGPKRAKQLGGHAITATQGPCVLKRYCKHPRGVHGADGMRAGGTNTHLEQVKCTDRHGLKLVRA